MIQIHYKPRHEEVFIFLSIMHLLESPELEICYSVYLRFACGSYANYGDFKLPFAQEHAKNNKLPEITPKVISYWSILTDVGETERLHVLRYQFEKADRKRAAARSRANGINPKVKSKLNIKERVSLWR